MLLGSVCINNKSQSVRLPVEARFDEHVKKVSIRTLGKERILCPVDNTWDSFFLSAETVTDDFLGERATQTESEREDF